MAAAPARPRDAGSRLGQLARRPAGSEDSVVASVGAERCELCNEPIGPEHRHLLERSTRELACACRPCALLFEDDAAGGGRYALLPERRLRLDGFALDEESWERLSLPVQMAFFLRSGAAGRVLAYYPSPMGPTESQLGLEAWEQIERANPILAELQPDVEALLVNRVGGARGYWLVPLDDCYRLIGLIRTHWRGLTGGKQVWERIAGFFEDLDRRARSAASAPSGTQRKGAST